MQTIRTDENEATFLEALSETCNVKLACERAGYARSTAYLWRKADPLFAKRWDEATSIGAEALEDEAVRRAREGWIEPVYYKGEVCGEVRKYSDTLLIFLLKGAMPKKYRDNVDMNVSGELGLAERIQRARERRHARENSDV